jgi:hypothetical protein
MKTLSLMFALKESHYLELPGAGWATHLPEIQGAHVPLDSWLQYAVSPVHHQEDPSPMLMAIDRRDSVGWAAAKARLFTTHMDVKD